MTGLLVAFGIIAGVVVLWLAVMFAAALLETQHAYEFVAMTEQNEVAATPYLASMAERAALAGYAHAGELRHVKYPLRISVWISPDRRTIARIAGGTLLKLPVKRTALISRLTNGKVVSTNDEISLPDLTELYTKELVLNGSFGELRMAHERWLSELPPGTVRTFDGDPPAELAAIEVEDVNRQIAFGYSRFVDATVGTYRHTLRGALRHVFRGVRHSFAQAHAQRDRSDRRRPG